MPATDAEQQQNARPLCEVGPPKCLSRGGSRENSEGSKREPHHFARKPDNAHQQSENRVGILGKI